MQTLQHIPVWVFALLIGLIALGLVQTRTRCVRKQRLLGINIALTVFTLVGVVQQWWLTPWLAPSLLSWAAMGLLVAWALGQGATPSGASYDKETRHYTVPGSWLPLALFMAIFACKFVVGMLAATAPESLHSANGHRHQRPVRLFFGRAERTCPAAIETQHTPRPAHLIQVCARPCLCQSGLKPAIYRKPVPDTETTPTLQPCNCCTPTSANSCAWCPLQRCCACMPPSNKPPLTNLADCACDCA